MKHIIFVQFILLTFLLSCEEEVNKPAFLTYEVTELTDQGVTYNAKVSLIGSSPVNDYGFVWATHSNPAITDSVYYFGEKPNTGTFSIRINDDLIPTSKYFVRAFLKSPHEVIYGNTIQFKSLGSAAPIISDFTPQTGSSDDMVTISGDHFSVILSNNSVVIGSAICKVVSASRTKLVAQIPTAYVTGHYPIKVSVAGKSVKSISDFTLEGATVQSISPTSGPAAIILTIIGKDFSTSIADNSVFIGDKESVVTDASATQLHVIVPVDSNPGPKEVSVQVHNTTGKSPTQFNLTGPTITSFSPTSGIQGSQVIITGTGFSTNPDENTVSIGNLYGSAQVISATTEQLVVVIPTVYAAGNVGVLVTVKSITTVAAIPFNIEGPEITSFTPGAQFGGRTITLFGKNFDVNHPNFAVLFLNLAATVISSSTTSLTIEVPLNLTVGCPIAVQVGGIVYKTTVNFTLLSPWQKQPAFPGGKRYGAVSFSVGSYAYVGMGIAGTGVDLKDLWKYDPSSGVWTKMADYPGPSRALSFSFTINGKAYVGGGGHYGYSGYDLINDLYDLWEYDPSTDSWTQKQSISAYNFSYGVVAATGVGSYGYLIVNNLLYRYDPSANLWTSSNSFPGISSSGGVAMTIGNKGYFGLGAINTTFWEFNSVTSTWTQLVNYPMLNNSGQTAIYFALNNKIYVGYAESFYDFDPSTGQWSRLPSNLESLTYSAPFSVNNIGYFATGVNGVGLDVFYSFNPDY